MMQIGRVRVVVLDACMLMQMTMAPAHRRVVRVVVVTIVVAMRVIVLEGVVDVRVRVLLAQMEHDAEGEERAREGGEEADLPIAERQRHDRADEWTERKDRAGASGAERPLCQEIEGERATVADGAERHEGRRRPERG